MAPTPHAIATDTPARPAIAHSTPSLIYLGTILRRVALPLIPSIPQPKKALKTRPGLRGNWGSLERKIRTFKPTRKNEIEISQYDYSPILIYLSFHSSQLISVFMALHAFNSLKISDLTCRTPAPVNTLHLPSVCLLISFRFFPIRFLFENPCKRWRLALTNTPEAPGRARETRDPSTTTGLTSHWGRRAGTCFER